MKSIRNLLIGMVIASGLAAGLHILHAQEAASSDLQVMLQAIESVPPTPADSAARFGTFYSAQHTPGTRLAWPPLPGNNRQLPVWNLGDGIYLLDDLERDYSMSLMSASPLPPGVGDGGTNDYVYNFAPPVYTTNDLWLEMIGKTNTTALMTIHEPWNVTNGVYDLFYTTNLSQPETWSWVIRSFAGLTNLTVNNATDAQGFYRLGQTNDLHENNSLGTNFWVAFNSMFFQTYGASTLSLYISSPVGASGTASNSESGIAYTFTVAAGAVTNMGIPSTAMMTAYDQVEQYGIYVTSSAPVSVYAMNYQQYVSAAFTCYPPQLLGTNYCIMSFPSDPEFGILATEDNTTVTITPSPTADLAGTYWMNPITNLQAGQMYQNNSANSWDDVTGTWIKSDKPIAVFAGSFLAAVPAEETEAPNPLMQEQMPVESWGSMTLALSFAGRTNGDTYRILAAYSNTVVAITGTVVTVIDYGIHPCLVTKTNTTVFTNLDAGKFCDIIVEGPAVFQADKPIQVGHFANGTLFDTANNNPNGYHEADPCEILLVPTGHYLETNVVATGPGLDFSTYPPGGFDEHYLNLIVPQSAITNTFVDTNPVAVTNFVAIGTSGYFGARLSVTNGTHTVTSSRPVGVEVYGFGYCDAYGYFGGWVK